MYKYKEKVQKNIGIDVTCSQSCLNYISDKYGLNWNDNSKLLLACRFINQINREPEKFLNYLIQQAEQETTIERIM